MRTIDHITMYGDPDEIFHAAADVEYWPTIMPHFRRIKVLREDEEERILKISAHRWFIPVKWTVIQTLDPDGRHIYYRHLGGITKGMEIEWSIFSQGEKARVLIMHDFKVKSRIIRSGIGRTILDLLFIKYISMRTLSRLRQYIETGSSGDTAHGNNGARSAKPDWYR